MARGRGAGAGSRVPLGVQEQRMQVSPTPTTELKTGGGDHPQRNICTDKRHFHGSTGKIEQSPMVRLFGSY